MIVLMAYPDDSCARLTLAEAQALIAARGPNHGLRLYDYSVVWDGTRDRDPYLTAQVERNRRHAVPPTTLGQVVKRVRTIHSIADLPVEKQRAIAADGVAIGPEMTARRWNLSRDTVRKVMKRQGFEMPANGRWKAAMKPHKKAAIVGRAQA